MACVYFNPFSLSTVCVAVCAKWSCVYVCASIAGENARPKPAKTEPVAPQGKGQLAKASVSPLDVMLAWSVNALTYYLSSSKLL